MLTSAEVTAALEPTLALVESEREASEAQRRPSRDVLVALAETGLMRLMVPTEYGGHGVHPATFVGFTETLARVHPSLGWTAMTCNEEAGITSAYLDGDAVRSLYENHPTTIVAGSGVAKGRAQRTEGGWSVTGRWPFVSGSTASDRLILTSIVSADGGARSAPPTLCFSLVPTDEVTIEDTWHTVGLRGTGSNDVVLDDHFVPDHWASGPIPSPPSARPDTPFYRLPSGLRFPFPKVGVATGVARAAMTEFVALAEGKRPLYSSSQLRTRAGAQLAVADAEAKVSSGRAWVMDVLDELWATAEQGDPIPDDLHARCRLACSHAVAECISAVEGLVAEAGSSANFASSPLAQLVSDARAIAGHFMVAPYQKETAGRVLLGLAPDNPGF